MININRHPDTPASLNTPEIQQYISDAAAYLQNNALPEPEKPVGYRSSDLLEAFDRDFFSKCYLTEEKFANSWIMDVEHFIPQSERTDLVYTWTNLFPAAHYANMIKPRNTPAGGLLDPSNPLDDVENEIMYSVSIYGTDPRFQARNDQNIKAVNTASLLNRVHRGHDPNTIRATETLRHAIFKRSIEILHKIIEWRVAAEGTQEKFQAQTELQGLLSRKASFTMLLRSMPAVRQLPALFFD